MRAISLLLFPLFVMISLASHGVSSSLTYPGLYQVADFLPGTGSSGAQRKLVVKVKEYSFADIPYKTYKIALG